MIKTYIDVPRRDYIYYIVHDLITLDNGWNILATVYKQNYVRFYFSYKWFQYGNVRALKKVVKRFEKLNKLNKWHYKPDIYVDDFAKKTAFSAEQYKKVFEEFALTIFIQGGIGCGDVEVITNDDGVVIGYKR